MTEHAEERGAERRDADDEQATGARRQVHVALLGAYRRLPYGLRRFLVARLTPSFQVGSGCVLRRADGAILLVRHSYRRGWGLPGGLLKRKEHPSEAAKREAFEELGVDVALDLQPTVVIDPEYRRIDVVFPGRLSDGSDGGTPSPRSPEIADVAWFSIDQLPELQREATLALVELRLIPRPPRWESRFWRRR